MKSEFKNKEGQMVIELLSSVLRNTLPEKPKPNLDWERVYKMANAHSVSGMVCEGILKLSEEEKPEGSIVKKFKEKRSLGILKEATQEDSLREILEAFEKEDIDSIVLKGSVIKAYYPAPYMRLMADIDVLVDKEKLKKIKEIMLDLGYYCKAEGGNHDIYYREPFMNIEIHRGLLPPNYDFNGYFESIWDRCTLEEGRNSTYKMSSEDFLIYMIGHLMKHYAQGGTGIRSIMDLYVFKQHFKEELNWGYVFEELKKIDLEIFYLRLEELSAYWFDDGEASEGVVEISEFILSSGTYGTVKNSEMSKFILNYKEESSFDKNKIIYLRQLLFPNKAHMIQIFPWLEKVPILLPLTWGMRGIRGLVLRPKSVAARLKTLKNSEKEFLLKKRDFYKKSGL